MSNVPKELAQPDDKMFERNLAILASKGREIVVEKSTGEKIRGFAAGLDKQYLQICQTEDVTLVLVNREHIAEIRETGRTLKELAEVQRDPIQDRVKTFMSVASSHSSRS